MRFRVFTLRPSNLGLFRSAFRTKAHVQKTDYEISKCGAMQKSVKLDYRRRKMLQNENFVTFGRKNQC